MARHGGSGGAGQHHKAHKGGRKRRRNNENGPGGQRQGLKRKGTSHQGAKRSRLQSAKAHREKLRARTIEEKRLSARGPPKVVAIVPLCGDVDASEVWRLLLDTAREGAEKDDNANGASGLDSMDSTTTTTTTTAAAKDIGTCRASSFYVPDVKVRLTLLPPFEREGARVTETKEGPRQAMFIRLLDYVKVADIVLFVTTAGSTEVIDGLGLKMCEVMRAFSLPNVYACVQGLGGLGLSEKAGVKKRTTKVFTEQVRDSVNCFGVDSRQDCLHLFRTLKEHKQIVPVWRKQRPYMLVDECKVVVEAASSQQQQTNSSGKCCDVSLSGFVRGQNLSVNQVILLPGVGEYHLDRVDQDLDPFAKARLAKKGTEDKMEEDARTLARADREQLESLARENIPDPLAGEQTWPTEEEMLEAEEMLETTKEQTISQKRVPKGFSDYQSAWIESGDEDSDDIEFEDSDDDVEQLNAFGGREAGQNAGNLTEHEGEFEIMSEDSFDEDGMNRDPEEEDDFDMDNYVDHYEREKSSRRAAEEEDGEFPDEVDVPLDKPARERFIKYRGLKSFRTSPWDPKESLPREYAKIFAFENPVKAHKQAKTRLRALPGKAKEGIVMKGEYVKLVFSGIPEEKAQNLAQLFSASSSDRSTPYVLFGLLQHETKMSLMNFSVHKSSSYEEPLANKDELIFYTGIRMFKARPVISDSAPNVDKHKNQRFLRAGERCTLSVYAPIHHPPLPLLCFKEDPAPESEDAMGCGDSSCALASAGLVSSVDPDRIVLKRIILTGYPHKVHKSKAYVRYMFHNPEDVKWFSPLELWTKYGRRGKIREPVGTHGTMKCLFDQVVQQRDTICLSLYKRVFPKWQLKSYKSGVI